MSPLRRPWESLPSPTVADPFASTPTGCARAGCAGGSRADRCDACGAIARVHVAVDRGVLLFCWTDYLAHEQALAARGYTATPCGTTRD